MFVYTKGKISRLIKIDFIRFCIVGGTGFCINFALLTLLRDVFKVEVFVAQFFAGEAALFSNFMLHHHWTFKHKEVKKSFKKLLLQFHASSWPAILGSTVMVGLGVRILHLSNFIALLLTSAIILLWNFYWSKYVIWRGTTPKEVDKIVS